MRSRPLFIVSAAIAMTWIFAFPADALAWGPATHVFLSGSLLGGLAGVPPLLASLLHRYRRDFSEGSVWADVLVGKKYAEASWHCHSWSVGHSLLESASGEREQVFALGYLSHLAADTVAHGHFVPRSLMLSRMPENLGHFYWELRADGLLDQHWWDQVGARVGEVSTSNRMLLESILQPTMFSFQTNRMLFESQLASYGLDRWYRLVTFAERNARWPLSGPTMDRFYAESVERMLRVLRDPADPTLMLLDPTGGSLPQDSVETRRSLRRLIRAGNTSEESVLREADRLLDGLSLAG